MPDIKFDPRSNTSSGRPTQAPSKESGAAMCARVMQRAEKPQCTSNGGPIRFEMEAGNHAKKINMNAMPK